MLRDVFYYGSKPNVHPREQYAESFDDARQKCTTEHFWIINEFCDYRGFDWDWDFEFLPDEDVWAERHCNIWPSQHQKDSGTWLCSCEEYDLNLLIYRGDVNVVKRKNIKTSNWVELDLIDPMKFDFSWHPDPTDPPYIYKWGNKFAPVQLKTCLEYHCDGATEVKYMTSIVELLPQVDRWTEHQAIDKTKFDMSWRPDPLDPPLNYVWGNKYIDGILKPTLEYRVPDAVDTKYMPDLLTVLPEYDRWVEVQAIDKTKFDFSWRPDPREPAYIYVWGNKYIDAELKPTLEYHCPGATEIKYMTNDVIVLPESDKWIEVQAIDKTKFDLSWRPDPREPAYIYTWGNKYIDAELVPTLQYHCEGATEVKYMTNDVIVLPETNRWVEVQAINKAKFDMSWRPDPREPAYIYTWGNKYIDGSLKATLEYHCDGATERKYMPELLHVFPEWDKWVQIQDVDKTKFDFSWRPDPREPAYIYTWGNKYISAEFRPTVEYHCEGATEVKYMTNDVVVLPEWTKWKLLDTVDITSFDFSWRPDPKEPDLIYVFGNDLYDGTVMPTVEYHCDNATERKYISDIKVKLSPDKSLFEHLEDATGIDYAWRPDPTSPPYIYAWGNQWNKPEDKISIQYVVPGATEYKYMEERATRLPCYDNWITPDNIDESTIDYSWEPNPNDEAYIYEFATQWQKTGGPRYIVDNATQRKFIDDIKTIRKPSRNNWTVPDNIDTNSFDFSWHPDDTDPAYIYVFGTQWATSGGPVYTVHDATETKYVDVQVATAKPTKNNWKYDPAIVDDSKFDFSWHPDPREPAYIYVWGNKYEDGKYKSTIEYHADGATDIKYMTNDIVVLPEWNKWVEVQAVDKTVFDFTWRPDPLEPPYIYTWGNKHIDASLKPTLEYHCDNATERKYMSNDIVVLPEDDKWVSLKDIDKSSFDFSWRPDPREPAYIYTWGNKFEPVEISPTLEYHCENATEVKYMNESVNVLPQLDRWVEVQAIDKTKFDMSWRPDPREPAYIYVWGNKYIDGILKPTLEYHCPDATERKYMTNDVVVLPESDRWLEIQAIDKTKFDMSWRPDPREPAYIYVWGNKFEPAEITPTLQYKCVGATEIKYMDELLEVDAQWDKWVFLKDVDKTSFDFSWRPDPLEPPYIYTWGNKYEPAEITPTLQYRCEGATEIKYMDEHITVLPEWDRWVLLKDVDKSKFDFSWRPDPLEPPYIYTWGNKYEPAEITPTLEYHCPDATEVKYMSEIAPVLPEWNRWEIPSNVNRNKFDFTWRPDPREPAFIYKFATVWNNRGGPVYTVPGATEIKYMEDVKAELLPNRDNWDINNVDTSTFDFSWVPHPDAPAYIYQFGTLEDAKDGPRYISPNTMGEVVKLRRVTKEQEEEQIVAQYYIQTTLDDLVKQHPDELFWAKHKNIDYSSFDFNWRPEMVEISYQLDYVHVFGSPESELTQTYFVSGKNYLAGKTSFNFIEIDTKLDDKTLFKLFKKSDMFYVDKGNSESQARFDRLKLLHPQIQKTRYLNSWVDTIKRCTNRATSELIWVLNSELDYTEFDFEYYPNPWQMKMVNVFGTQWSHWGTTFLVNRETFAEDTKYINIIEHLSNINFVKTIRANATHSVYDAIIIDHGNKELDTVIKQVTDKTSGKNVTVVKYNESYLKTLKDIVTRLQDKKEHYLWLCSSVCDYSSFDFSYTVDPFARDNLHVFPSGKQKFGDTFFIDVNKTKEIIDDMLLLEDYHKVNYNGTMKANRLPEPIIVTSNDTLIDAAINIEGFPYATIISSDNKNISVIENEPMNLWSPETKTIMVTSTGATRITVPREVKDHVKKELYDYPYIKKASKLAISSPMDIVYLSNGETGAEENWEHLQKITQGLKNRVVRVDGVNGRVQAYHAALEASETPWAFTVFAKLKISPKFDFNWQPDRMQVAKHYVFHAKNPVNGLIYGHQAMIAYNKKLTLANKGTGLDFTLDDEHEVVPLLSGVANYNTDEFSTWRTAFREVLKLKAEDSEVARQRLYAWLNKATGDYFQYSIKGAIDADEYYDEVDGDFEMLKLSYEWAWLKERFANS